jgi:hypothetical protein
MNKNFKYLDYKNDRATDTKHIPGDKKFKFLALVIKNRETAA